MRAGPGLPGIFGAKEFTSETAFPIPFFVNHSLHWLLGAFLGLSLSLCGGFRAFRVVVLGGSFRAFLLWNIMGLGFELLGCKKMHQTVTS